MEVKLPSGRKFTTPSFFPVYNPNIPIISPNEMRSMGVETLITNAYILYKKGIERRVHEFLGFDGVVMMDSGAYQLWEYGDLDVTNEDIIEYQNRILPDIGTFLDTVMEYDIDRKSAEIGVKETLTNAEVCRAIGDDKIAWMATVQGALHKDLVEIAAERLRELDFPYYAIGSLKKSTQKWMFEPQIDHSVWALNILPRSKPVHLWGVGHPAVFSIFVLMGFDTFDSASYALYAKDNRVMFPWGTERLENMEEFPYTCKECEKFTVKELLSMDKHERVRILAKHNLWVMINEIKAIREALRGEYLFELVQERVRSHPGLFRAFVKLLKEHYGFLEQYTPFTKKHGLFPVGEEFVYRPEIKRALDRIKMWEKDAKILGIEIPSTLFYTYPFGHIVHEGSPPSIDPTSQARDIIKYQWGVEIEHLYVTERKGRARMVYKDETYIGMIRPSDGLFVPSIEGAKLLVSLLPHPKGRIVVDSVAEGPVSEGRSVFSKFVLDVDPDLRPNQEVIVVNESDEVLAVGKLVLSPKEITEFSSHVAVKVRHGSKLSHS